MPRGEGTFHFEPGEETGSTDEARTELIISDAGSLNTDSVESRPAIIISRGPFAWGNTNLDHFLKQDLPSGMRTHTDLLTGSFVLNCISRSGLEAETLAVIVGKAIRTYRRELQKAGFFQIGHLVQVGQETPAGSLVAGDSTEDFINVPVSFPIFYQESWTVEKEAVLLAAMSARVEAVAVRFDGSLLVPGSVDADGNPVEGSAGVIIQAWTV